ncbi:hypothetical protein IU510_29490 [Nocardia cyriacigeorgica]|uniref:RRQRL motif-containing zinc-binding protein n=1 Tax=Nocardia cyriacigeorgica TaxID=135487 RepID=UPI0018932F1C|nr:RRQRL motif-containing zinc-binding protein [Nocardia cyriacigeorgica]MBF6102153.1 hypothetical protein [Nocardia cyriacigeorgica]MBF6347354.1 hypothetical protein [Nocardia cyriacigeorgica]
MALREPPEPDTYDWNLAPAHLKTRRQLRAAGLRPNGQEPAALIVREPSGRRKRLWAYLFDTAKAAPKRTATPAQLEAVAKAVRERQARAAERRGITREDLTRPSDPGPQWQTPAPSATTHKENTGMPETSNLMTAENQHYDDRAQAKEQMQLGVASGHGQRQFFLLATVAVNQARIQRSRRDADYARAEQEGADALDELDQAVAEAAHAAGQRLQSISWENRPATALQLADALMWQGRSDTATEQLGQILADFEQCWGVRVDPEALTVDIDPSVDVAVAQDYAEAAALWGRESSVIDFVSAMPLPETSKDAVMAALNVWHGDDLDPDNPRAHLESELDRRTQLDTALAETKLSSDDRARVEFVVDYLRGDTSRVDLLASPVYVDPGEEARGRVTTMLDAYADHKLAPQEIGEQISVMTSEDQEKVRAVGRRIAAELANDTGNPTAVDTAVWPGYVDRDKFTEALQEYAADAGELAREAHYVATTDLTEHGGEEIGVSDDIGARIERMATTRDALREQALHSPGLHALERAQLMATISDIDTGRITTANQLPELLLIDERSKAAVDEQRILAPAAQLADTTRQQLTELVGRAGIEPGHRAAAAIHGGVNAIGDSLSAVASGATTFGIDRERAQFTERRAKLGQALTSAAADPEIKTQIRQLIDDRARDAGKLGRPAASRHAQWNVKTERIVATRDRAIARTAAVAAGRAPRTGNRDRSAATRGEQSTGQTAAHRAAAPAGRRQLHGEEISR